MVRPLRTMAPVRCGWRQRAESVGAGRLGACGFALTSTNSTEAPRRTRVSIVVISAPELTDDPLQRFGGSPDADGAKLSLRRARGRRTCRTGAPPAPAPGG